MSATLDPVEAARAAMLLKIMASGSRPAEEIPGLLRALQAVYGAGCAHCSAVITDAIRANLDQAAARLERDTSGVH